MPTTSSLQKWQDLLVMRVSKCALNKTEDDVQDWLRQAEGPKSKRRYEKLSKVKSEWVGINRKLNVALLPLLVGDFGRSIEEERAERKESGKPRPTSLQILSRLYHHLQTNPDMHEVHGIQDLMSLKWMGDSNKTKFRHQWRSKCASLSNTVDITVKSAFLLQCLSESKEMQTQIQLHKAKYRGHESRRETPQTKQERYDDLIGIMNDHIKNERRDRNRDQQLHDDAKKAGKEGPAAPGLEGDGGGKGKDKGKGKGKGKDKGKGTGKGGDPSKGTGKGKKGEKGGWSSQADAEALKTAVGPARRTPKP